jgi:hypothetical protein
MEFPVTSAPSRSSTKRRGMGIHWAPDHRRLPLRADTPGFVQCERWLPPVGVVRRHVPGRDRGRETRVRSLSRAKIEPTSVRPIRERPRFFRFSLPDPDGHGRHHGDFASGDMRAKSRALVNETP